MLYNVFGTYTISALNCTDFFVYPSTERKKEKGCHNSIHIEMDQPVGNRSRVAQWKRAGPITQRSVDRNYALLVAMFFLIFHFFCPLSFSNL